MPGLTKETFLAMRQTFPGITGVEKYLINYCGFKYLPIGKIQSDTIEQPVKDQEPHFLLCYRKESHYLHGNTRYSCCSLKKKVFTWNKFQFFPIS